VTNLSIPTTGHNSDAEPKTVRELAKAWANKNTQSLSSMKELLHTIREKNGTVEQLKDKTSNLRHDIDEGIVDHFKAAARKLVRHDKATAKLLPDTPPAGTLPSLDFVSKQGRKYWQQQISSYRDKIVKAMSPKAKKKSPAKDEGKPERKDDMVWFTEWLQEGTKRCNATKAFDDVTIEALSVWLEKMPVLKKKAKK
tara:strand:+ start:69 stop:659 length:591 start_codon:yes stop_codon:yes gene_type:complete